MRNPSPPAILIVDDEPESVRILQLNLEARGYHTIAASNGAEALRLSGEMPFDIVLLDLMLPDMDGLQLCRQMRAASSRVGIIVTSARAMYSDKAMALARGADDYLVKPFGVEQLLGRLEATLRRLREKPRFIGERVAFEGWEFDPSTCRLIFGPDVEIELTSTECALLQLLVANAGTVVTPDTMLTQVWEYDGQDGDHPLAYIRRLRLKLRDDEDSPRLLFTHPGMGYRFTDKVTFQASATGCHSASTETVDA